MRIIKHFIKVGRAYLVRIGCKHDVTHEGSCPFTGMTYTTCSRCLTRVGVRKTDE